VWLPTVFGSDKVVIGVVHLPPLPGSPFGEPWEAILNRAMSDAQALVEGGVDGVLVENYGDAPFTSGRVPPHTVACMTVIAREIRRTFDVPVGINVLRNDPISALAVALAAEAAFIRVNVLVGVVAAPEGLLIGDAFHVLRYRQQLRAKVRICADAWVKHGVTLSARSFRDAVIDTVERGRADAVIISGARTGEPPDLSLVKEAKELVNVPVLVGSGVTPDNLRMFLEVADGVIVGTYFKKGGVTTNPVDVERVKQLIASARSG